MNESVESFLKRVEDRAKELYAMSDQGNWDDLGTELQSYWINYAGRELRGETNE